jgi:hypothetical protein
VLTFTSNLASIAPASYTIADTNLNVAAAIDTLAQNLSKLKTINLTTSSSNLPLTFAQYTTMQGCWRS